MCLDLENSCRDDQRSKKEPNRTQIDRDTGLQSRKTPGGFSRGFLDTGRRRDFVFGRRLREVPRALEPRLGRGEAREVDAPHTKKRYQGEMANVTIKPHRAYGKMGAPPEVPGSVQETPRKPGVFRLWRPVSRSVWGRFGSFLDR